MVITAGKQRHKDTLFLQSFRKCFLLFLNDIPPFKYVAYKTFSLSKVSLCEVVLVY